MPAKTDFNVSPYWDDWSLDKDFYRVLFRPGYAVQARELTTLQTILQNQIEQFGNHVFKDGAIVIPGSVGYDSNYYAVKIQPTHSSGTVSDYLNQYAPGYPTADSVGAIITGGTSGVTAQVVGYAVADSSTGDPDTLFIKYLTTNTTDNTTQTFTDDEYISANRAISSYAADVASAQLQATSATATGSAVSVLAGIYFIRGFMVQNNAETITLDKYTNTPSYRIGWTVTETLVTPEMDPSLLDNAQGSSNYAAKGANRFKMSLALTKKTLTTTDDSNFVELARVENGVLVNKIKYTEYSIIEDMLARRTNDESGDYITKHFDIEVRENLNDGTNRGIYTAANGGVETKETFSISPGKAYVDGYEVELQGASYVNFDKARTSRNVQNDTVPANLGQYVEVTNIYGQPDITESGSTLDPFKEVKLYDQQTSSRGSAAGANIGYARSRAFEYSSGVVGTAAIYHHYLFDITMFTTIVVSTSPYATLTAGALVTGSTSGATGYVVAAVSSGSQIQLMQVQGAFSIGENYTSSVSTDTVSGTISTITQKNFARDVKQIFMDTSAGGAIDYTGDVSLTENTTLGGQVSWASATTVTGLNTTFTLDLVVGDIVAFPSGASGALEERSVLAVTNDTTISIDAVLSNPITNVSATRKRGKIQDEEEVILVYKMPEDNVKTLLDSGGNTDTSFNFRKQITGVTTNASGVATFTVPSGQTFLNPSVGRNYALTIVVAGSGTGAVGDVVDITSTATGTGTTTLTVTDLTILGNAATVELMATIKVAISTQKTKTAQKMTTKNIQSHTGGGTYQQIYGERIEDREISLSYSDVYTLHAVYESTSNATDAVGPTLTISGASGSFTVGELITGSATNATGRVIGVAGSTLSFVKVEGTFSTTDRITGGTSATTASLTATTLGDSVVTSHFLLDTGQRDSFYDVGRVVRKANAQTPTGRLLVVYDYFTHGTGDYFSVDSYTDQVEYKNIPEYEASKIDTESRAPKGLYQLRDSLDFRPAVKSQTTPTKSPFVFDIKNFEDAGATNGNLVEPDGSITLDFDFYLPRKDLLYLDKLANWIVVQGTPSDQPIWPATENANMLIAKYSVPAYTFEAKDVEVIYQKNKGYKMEDIGNLEERIAKLEYATSLGLLERETDSYMILDGDGLNRFKSGFIVDNFVGHNVGNSQYPDYQCSVDSGLGHMRPVGIQRIVELEEENTTDAQRTADTYTKTGDLITLPYTETDHLVQPYASRAESVNPYSVTQWIGNLQLSPESDIWMDDTRIPAITINVEGNYEQMLREQTEAGALGTIWNSWNTTWSGNRRSWTSGQSNGQIWGSQGWTQTTTSVDLKQRRTGSETRLVERIDNISAGDRVTNIEIVPWIRARNVDFVAQGMKPNTRVYAFFDKVDVNSNTKPTGATAQSTTLTANLAKADTTITVASTTGFPTTGTIAVGNLSESDPFGPGFITAEEITYTGKTSTTFTGCTRNANFVLDEAKNWLSTTPVTDQIYGGQLITDNIGTVNGRFRIPNTASKRFRIGRRSFRLTDSSTDSRIAGFVNTSAEKEYQAIGHVQTKQELIMATRNGQLGTRTVEETREFTQITNQRQAGGWYDPLAQTIMCDSDGGMFITSVDLFFSHKHTSLPVWVEVRTVKNGYPTQEILPFGVKQLEPASVNINPTDGTTATKFSFDAPIYLRQGKEYAIVVASNSPDYKIWISRLGETDIGGVRAITTQPTLGSLFKSQNASTWTASQYEDMKFTLRRAKFTTGTTGQFSVVNQAMTVDNGYIPVLPSNPIEVDSTVANKVKVNFINHANYDVDSYVILSGVKSNVGDTALNGAITNSATTITCDDVTNFPTASTVRIDDELITYTGKTGTTQLTGCVRGTVDGDGTSTTAAAHDDNSIVQLYEFAGIPLIQINRTHAAITDVELDSFTIATTTSATSTIAGGGDAVRCTKNIPADAMQPTVLLMELPNTTATAVLQTTTGRSVASTTQNAYTLTSITSAIGIPLNEDYFFSAPQLVCSQTNETNQTTLNGKKSLRLSINMTSTVDNVSPVIDTQRMGMICVSNRLNEVNQASDTGALTNYTPITDASGDNNKAIYLTKKVALAQNATAIKLYLDAVVMAEAKMKVLYKIQRVDETLPFDDIAWTLFTGSGGTADGLPNPAVLVSKNREDFKEYKYLAGKKEDGTGTALDEFVAFAVKIVLQGTNSSLPPMVKDFRAIALAT